jgi:hypothetical protein
MIPQEIENKRINHSGPQNLTMAIVRYNNKQIHNLLSEDDFKDLMMKGPEEHDEILSIQNSIVTPNYQTEMIVFQYVAPFNEKNPIAPINYSLSNFESDNTLKACNSLEYARKLCTIMGKHISEMHNIEIISMKAIFLKDEYKNLWFFNAKNIVARICPQNLEEKGVNFFGLHIKNSTLKNLPSNQPE